MSKAVLISIRPEWVKKILAGENIGGDEGWLNTSSARKNSCLP